MRLHQLCTTMQKRHKNGESYRSLAKEFGITKPMAWQIAHGYKPGKKVTGILKLDPSSDLTYTRNRQKTLDQIAREWGFASWCAYETDMIHEKGKRL